MKKDSWELVFSDKMNIISKKKSVLDVGGGTGFQKGMARYRSLFSGNYRSFDVPGMGADIDGDIHAMPIQTESEDAVICNAVLEHVVNPIRAVEEIYRILKPGGVALVQVPSAYPYHGNKGYGGSPAYGDYWRFFEETLRYMFREFSEVEIVRQGGYFQAGITFSPLPFFNKHNLNWLMACFDRMFGMRRAITKGYIVYAKK